MRSAATDIEVNFDAGVVKSSGTGASINDMVLVIGHISKYRAPPFSSKDLNALLAQASHAKNVDANGMITVYVLR